VVFFDHQEDGLASTSLRQLAVYQVALDSLSRPDAANCIQSLRLDILLKGLDGQL